MQRYCQFHAVICLFLFGNIRLWEWLVLTVTHMYYWCYHVSSICHNYLSWLSFLNFFLQGNSRTLKDYSLLQGFWKTCNLFVSTKMKNLSNSCKYLYITKWFLFLNSSLVVQLPYIQNNVLDIIIIKLFPLKNKSTHIILPFTMGIQKPYICKTNNL